MREIRADQKARHVSMAGSGIQAGGGGCHSPLPALPFQFSVSSLDPLRPPLWDFRGSVISIECGREMKIGRFC
jgi:hypothetical protein